MSKKSVRKSAAKPAAKSGVPDEQPLPESPVVPHPREARPARLGAAAVLVAVEGFALVAVGLYMLVMGLFGSPDRPEQAEMGGLTLVALAVLPLLAANGLRMRRSWSRGPAVITQLMALPVAYTLMTTDAAFSIPAGIALGAIAVVSLALLLNPAVVDALGIKRGPRGA
ncbi:hypothetical protein GCM10010329_00850 [Streptomyces spiroverticillatus]|uniref:Integral membrane protein n=1 Tax=Streptomyces finlayi TaxID=67296 RepID=A0A918WS07_9ACTN|nr:hypothetical protein GCM10010329_00850 [Streptomyces spiroverticillatus]GHC76839.1 hypothetical protein GCM10010334_00850 [Streptomyces finlayi]